MNAKTRRAPRDDPYWTTIGTSTVE
jgi:hypothetical protein